jgi:hypothetical protein
MLFVFVSLCVAPRGHFKDVVVVESVGETVVDKTVVDETVVGETVVGETVVGKTVVGKTVAQSFKQNQM